MSNRLPSTGTAPSSTSMPQLASIRASVTYETPRTHAAKMMMHDAMPPIASPTPGMKPTMPSSPKRRAVPGMRNQSSSRCDSRSRFSSSKAVLPRCMRGVRISGLANGTTIVNQGSIVFDVNSAISTNSVTNTIDSVYPTSSVAALPATTTSTSCPVSWSGTDPGGSGIADYDIYVSTNSGDYSLWLPATTQTSGTYTGAVGQTYSFYSMATDNVGLRQQAQGAVQIVSVIQASSRTTPSVTVSPASSSITTTQALSVTVVVNGGSGNPAATGSVTL